MRSPYDYAATQTITPPMDDAAPRSPYHYVVERQPSPPAPAMPTWPNNEAIDDRVASLLVAGANIAIVYDDPAGTLTISSTGGGASSWDDLEDKPAAFPPEQEAVEDLVGSLLVAGDNIEITYNDASNTLEISATPAAGGSGVAEAPLTGGPYARQGGAWTATLDIAISEVSDLQTALDGKAPTVHTHAIADTTGLQAALDSKAASSHTHLWADITDKPATFAPEAHNQATTTITFAATDKLLGRATAGGGQGEEITCTAQARQLLDDTTFPAMLTTLGAAASGHTHGGVYEPADATLTALAGLNTTVGLLEQTGTDAFAKRALGVAAGTSIPTRADADTRYAAASHTHAQSEVTSLVSDLALKAPLVSPVFTGDPQAPTPAVADNDTSVATTAWVKSQWLQNSVVFDPPSQATNVVGVIQTLTVTGAALGDFAIASFSLPLQGMTLIAWVSAANTVQFQFQNKTAGTLDLASGTVRVRVLKQ